MRKYTSGLFLVGVSFFLSACSGLHRGDGMLTSPISQNASEKPRHIALLLPLKGALHAQSQAVRDGFTARFEAARLQTEYQIQKATTLSVYDTADYGGVKIAYNRAIQEGADFVVGPLEKGAAQSLMDSNTITVPTLLLNYVKGRDPLVYQFGLSPEDEMKQLVDKLIQDKHQSVLLITPPDAWGVKLKHTFESLWHDHGGRIPVSMTYASDMSTLSTQIATALQYSETKLAQQGWRKRRVAVSSRQDIDAIVLLAIPKMARQIVPLVRFYGGNRLPIYATSWMYSGRVDPRADRDLDGVLFLDIPGVQGIVSQNNTRLYALGIDSYEITQHLNKLRHQGSLAGSTGVLSLGLDNRIFRLLRWFKMQNGLPVVL